MEMVTPVRSSISIPTFVAIIASIAGLVIALFYLGRPASQAVTASRAPQEARSYVHNLQLSEVTMQATENFMNQQVVEVQGKIANQGPKPLRSVDVYCLFRSVDGQEIRRERLPIIAALGSPLRPGETRQFRLPFDSIPEGWNQALPQMVIAQIAFAN